MLPDRAHMMRLLVCHSKAIRALTKEEDDRVKLSVLALSIAGCIVWHFVLF